MTDVELGLDAERPETVGGFSSSPSFVDLIKQDIDELAQSKFVDIPIPGYSKSNLSARYSLPESGRDLDELARAVMRDFKDGYSRNLYISIDMMIELCQGLYVQPDGQSEPMTVDPDLSGIPIRYGQVAVTFGWDDVDSTRGAVVKLFGGNEMAILAHAEKLNRWMQNTKANVNAEFWQPGE